MAEAQLQCLAHEGLGHDGEIDNTLGQRGTALGVAPRGDDPRRLIGTNIKTAQSEERNPMSDALPRTIDAADLAFELVGGGNVLLADDVIDEGVRTMPRIITVSAPVRRELTSVVTEIAETSISPASMTCRTIGWALDADDRRFDAVFLQELFLSQHLDCSVGRAGAGPGDADALLGVSHACIGTR